MRGKVHGGFWYGGSCGITPAYAGKRRLMQSVYIVYGDHPRLCGEKFRKQWHKGILRGSPPPMRGKAEFLFLPRGAGLVIRITPAYAGKSRIFIFTPWGWAGD